MKKFNYDEFEWSKFKKPWNHTLELVPANRLTVRNCTVCSKPLPADRHFIHDECMPEDGADELHIAALHELHLPSGPRRRTA